MARMPVNALHMAPCPNPWPQAQLAPAEELPSGVDRGQSSPVVGAVIETFRCPIRPETLMQPRFKNGIESPQPEHQLSFNPFKSVPARVMRSLAANEGRERAC